MMIGKKIKDLRTELNMSVDELAEKLGKNRATIYRYEKGDIGNLPLDVLEPLATALKTTPAYLMGWDTDENDDLDNLSVGKLLKLIRTQHKMTTEEYSKQIGIKPETLEKYESGEKHIPISVVNTLSEYYRLVTAGGIESERDGVVRVREVRFKEWTKEFGHIKFTDEEYKKIFEYCKFLVYLRDIK